MMESLEGESETKRRRISSDEEPPAEGPGPDSEETEEPWSEDFLGAGELSSKPVRQSESDDPLGMDSFAYQILELDDIWSQMKKIVEESFDVIQTVPHSTLRVMLNHVSWDKEKLIAKYFDDFDKFMEEAKVQDAGAEVEGTLGPEPTCAICWEDMTEEGSHAMSCGDRFCNFCWEEYLTKQIMDEGGSQCITCPAASCSLYVEDRLVERLVKDPKVREKYKLLFASHFVSANKRMRWCTEPGCNKAVCVDVAKWAPVSCSCGFRSCFMCSGPWHEPIKCDLLKKWLKKQVDDSETGNWLRANTKDCPKCGTMIEKNGGCNHMTCRSPSCSHHFCWICGGDWNRHAGNAYNCNKYDAERTSRQSAARSSLQRYLHYHARHVNHAESLKFEHKLEPKLTVKTEEFQRENHMAWFEVQFLHQALKVLCQCRRTLMNTYPFAFYLSPSNESEIFESNQADLEGETETLSDYLENELFGSKHTPAEMARKIKDKSAYCEQRRLVLVRHVYEGYANNTWAFQD